MYTTAFIAILLAATASALPTQENAVSVEKRDSGTFKICNEPNFRGPCVVYAVEKGSCYNFGPGVANLASSFSSPSSLGTCQIYSEYNCKESRRMAGIAGGTVDRDLYRPRKFDNANRSIRCGINYHPFQGMGLTYKRNAEPAPEIQKDAAVPTLVGVLVAGDEGKI